MTVDPYDVLLAANLGDVLDVSPIHAGLSGAATYLVRTSMGDFVLKVQDGDGVAWNRATSIQRLAAEAGVAPPLVYTDAARTASLSRRVDGVPLTQVLGDPSLRSRALMDIVQRLRTLHAIPIPAGVQIPDTSALVNFIWRSQVVRAGFPRWAVPLGDRLSEANAVMTADARRVLSHGDLHPANLFWDGTRAWLLDWEVAGPDHPYADLATLANLLALPEEAALALLSAQEGHTLDAKQRSVFRAARERNRIVYGAVFLRLVPDLTQVTMPDRERTPTLGECLRQLATGAVRIGTPDGHATIGAALLRGTE